MEPTIFEPRLKFKPRRKFIIMLFILGSLKSTLNPEFLTSDQGKNDIIPNHVLDKKLSIVFKIELEIIKLISGIFYMIQYLRR